MYEIYITTKLNIMCKIIRTFLFDIDNYILKCILLLSWYFRATHVHIINVSRKKYGFMLLICFALYKGHLYKD